MQDAELLQGEDLPLGPATAHHLGDQLHGDRGGEDRLPVHLVVEEEQVVRGVEHPGDLDRSPVAGAQRQAVQERQLLVRSGRHGRPSGRGGVQAPRAVAEHDRRFAPGPALDLVDDRHHPARPGAVETERQGVEGLVGRGIVALPGVPEAPGDRGEQDEEPELLRTQPRGQGEGAVHLGAEDPVERLRCLVLDPPVFDRPGAVDHPVDPAEFEVERVEQGARRRRRRAHPPGRSARWHRPGASPRDGPACRGPAAGGGRPLRPRRAWRAAPRGAGRR